MEDYQRKRLREWMTERRGQKKKQRRDRQKEEKKVRGIILDWFLLKLLVGYWKSIQRLSSTVSAIGPQSSVVEGQFANSSSPLCVFAHVKEVQLAACPHALSLPDCLRLRMFMRVCFDICPSLLNTHISLLICLRPLVEIMTLDL